MIYPPARYGTIEENLYRGCYPKERNFTFLKRLSLKTIVSLVPDSPSLSLTAFCVDQSISLVHIRTDKPKENTIPLTYSKVIQILNLVVDPLNHPLYLHCLDGTLVTCVMVLCLRKLQGFSPSCYVPECVRYAKEETLDEAIDFVEKFNGEFEIHRLPKWLWNGFES